MRRSLLYLAWACVLLALVAGRSLAETAARSVLKPETRTPSAAAQDGRHSANAGNQYFVECGIAKKDGNGRSPAAPWSTLTAVNERTFLPGDVIYLKRGTECHGQLWPKGSGSSASVIRLSAYGNGERPKVIADKGDEEVFKLFDQEYWDVDSIDFAGGTLFGVFVSGHAPILHHIHVRNLLVHDVHGGAVKNKESGLVVISPGTTHEHFEDVLVEGVTAYGTEQWSGILVGGGNFGEVPAADWSTHVVVRNSVVHDVYGDGIILFRVRDGLIDASAAWHTGMQPTESIGTPNAIWTWMCQDCVVRRSEAFLTDSPGVDGGAFDIDWGNTRNSVIDNYGHDTQGYCVAVFGAGYVTHDSVVDGNLCINNGRSPRMARYQGAIFIWTWNDGAIENLRVQKNTIYWTPPGNFPAVLNHADLRGSQRIFRDNHIYSSAPWMVDSNKDLAFQDNRYTTCERNSPTWVFDSRTYSSFDEYRAGTGQDDGSTWRSENASTCFLGITRGTRATGKAANANGTAVSGWTIISEIPVSIDAQGLLDATSATQLLVLKNLNMQFRARGLRMTVTLAWKDPSARASAPNLMRDQDLRNIETSDSFGYNVLARPKTRLVTPDGSISKEWQDFVGPAEIGLAVRSALGKPLYSQIGLEAQ